MKASYTPEQLNVIIAVYQDVCRQRMVDPISRDGVEIAAKLLIRFQGYETTSELKRKILQ